LFARWTHDVLLVNRGVALVRSDAFGVTRTSGPLTNGDPDAIRGLGTEPVLFTVVLDNGASVQIAAPADATAISVGPFAGDLRYVGEANPHPA
jgi:hypothetical protein